MKKIKLLVAAIITISLSLLCIQPLLASAATTNVTGGTNGPLCNSGGYFTPASVTVTSGDTITFSVPQNDPYVGGVQVNGFPQGSFVIPRGGSVTTQAITASVSYQGTWPNSPSCIKGSGTVTVQAPPNPTNPSAPSTPSTPTQNTTSTTSTNTPTKSTNTSSLTAAAPASSATTPAIVPETVVADTIVVNGNKVTSSKNLTINQTQPLELSGTTVANGKITLTIHSTPKTVTVQADASGKWSYTVTGLLPGDHTIYATVSDPATNQTSAQSKLLNFTVAAMHVSNAVPVQSVTAKKNTSSLMSVIPSVVVVLILVIVAVVYVNKKKNKISNIQSATTQFSPTANDTNPSQTEPTSDPKNTSTQTDTDKSPESDDAHK